MDGGPPQPVRVSSADGAQVLRLSGVINIMAADALLAGARTVAGAKGPVRIECDDAESFDVSSLQVLIALRRELLRQERSVDLVNVRSQAAEDIALAGLQSELMTRTSDGNRRSDTPARQE